MDVLSGLLDGPRAHTPFLLRVVMESPWAIDVRDEAPLTVVVVTAGRVIIVYADGAQFSAEAGDIVIVRGPDHYVFTDAVGTRLTAVIYPDGVCRSEFGSILLDQMSLGVRTWGNAAPGTDGSSTMLIGTYTAAGEVSSRLLAALDRTIVVKGVHSSLARLLDAEMMRDAPGYETVVNRLLDLMLVTSLREWFDRPGAGAPRWYTARADPVVGQVLRLIHNDIAHSWSIAELASAVGVSRAGLSRRFTDLVGEPPMTYITDWRLSIAADLLADPAHTVEAVAREVGYGSAFALSAAFKRSRGMGPREFRKSLSTSRI